MSVERNSELRWGFTQFCSVIGPENLSRLLNRSDAKLKTNRLGCTRFPALQAISFFSLTFLNVSYFTSLLCMISTTIQQVSSSKSLSSQRLPVQNLASLIFGHSEKARKTSHIYCLTLRKVFLDVIVKLQLECGFDKNVAVTLVF